jgi:hypothetical protein
MAKILVGPLLRYVSETEATVWVETDEPCEVEILGTTEPTFTVEGHHFALVRIEDLEPGSSQEYEVALDGERRWPEEGSDLPPSVIRTMGRDTPLDIAFGSCRVALPHDEPYVKTKDEHSDGFEFDALYVLAIEMIRDAKDREDADRSKWPELLFLLGDQVYVDEGSPQTREKIRNRRGTDDAPGEEVTDFEEYTWLYQESWQDPIIRWLFSTVSTSMVWDDHDMSDDWNISRSWVEEMNQKPWWHHRVVAGIMSYWIYQHIGNLSPRELDEDEVYREVRGNDRAGEPLRKWATEIDSTEAGTRWSFCRDLGDTRAIFLDSRAGRTFENGRRAMVDDEEWDWIVEHAQGDFDHLLLATTIPYLLAPALHYIEAWGEQVGAGAWGKLPSRLAEKLRRAVDFDHWASFSESFQRLTDLIEEIGSGKRGKAPATIVVLSGDVHHAYLAEATGFSDGMQSRVYQAVCSPYRNPLDEGERRVIRASFKKPAIAATRTLAKSAGAPQPRIDWKLRAGPFFDNQVATLRLHGRDAEMQLDKTVPGDEKERHLECVFEEDLV